MLPMQMTKLDLGRRLNLSLAPSPFSQLHEGLRGTWGGFAADRHSKEKAKQGSFLSTASTRAMSLRGDMLRITVTQAFLIRS